MKRQSGSKLTFHSLFFFFPHTVPSCLHQIALVLGSHGSWYASMQLTVLLLLFRILL